MPEIKNVKNFNAKVFNLSLEEDAKLYRKIITKKSQLLVTDLVVLGSGFSGENFMMAMEWWEKAS